MVRSPDGRQIIGYGLLNGPNWYFLVTYPRSAMVWSAAKSASWILLIGLVASLVEAGLAMLMARRSVGRPLQRLAAAAEADVRGRGAALQDIEARRDEIGLLARTLRSSRERVDEVLESLEQRVQERTAELKTANQEKSRFLANMSHELRTPLNGVVAVSEVLAQEQSTPRGRELAELIASSGRLLERVLGDILDVSKIEAGQMSLEVQDFELTALVGRIAELHRAAAETKGLIFTWSSAAGVYRGDPVRLTQILSNLLSNAIKFTEAGEIRLSVEAAPGGLAFKVSDTGIGFDTATQARLFRRFEQADASITRRFGGAGLGLAICRSLARLMGGEIEAASAPDEGSTFTVRLPLERVQRASDAEAPAAHRGRDLDGVTILVAEDHPTNQRVIQLILEALGANIRLVDNGREALDALAQEPFDVVLMDMQMPEMDGLTATARLRARESAEGRAPTPVIMLTANAFDEHVRSSQAAGANLHLAKPIRPEALVAAIERVLGAEADSALEGAA